MNQNGVSFRPMQANRKLSPVEEIAVEGSSSPRFVPRPPYCASTYVSIEASCPRWCAFKDKGCYAQTGYAGPMIRKLDRDAEHVPNIAQAEADVIDAMWPSGVPQDGARGGRDLRLHVSGDVVDEEGARILGAAAGRFRARGGGLVWTYTHRWMVIPRAAWGEHIAVFASTETPEAASRARELGYAVAIVVRSFPHEHRAFTLPGLDALVIPCPAQVGTITCVECRMCMRDRRFNERGLVVAFEIHGTAPKKAKTRLPVFEHDNGPLFARRSA